MLNDLDLKPNHQNTQGKGNITCIPFSLTSMEAAYASLPTFFKKEQSQKRLEEFLAFWPSNLEPNLIGFESPLQEGVYWNDFHLFFPPSEKFIPLRKVPFFASPEWKSIVNLQQEERNPGKGNIRIELDLGSCPDWPPKPNLFFSIEKQDSLEIIKEIFFRLTQTFLPNSFFDSLCLFMQAPYHLKHVGFMLGRFNSILLSIKTDCLDLKTLERFFSFQPHLLGLVQRMKPLSDLPIYPLGLTLEIGKKGNILPKIGVGLGTHKMSKQEIGTLLEELSLRQLISEEKKEELISWKGIEKELPYCSESSSKVLFKSIYCLKFICSRDQPLMAKVYLSVERFSVSCQKASNPFSQWCKGSI